MSYDGPRHRDPAMYPEYGIGYGDGFEAGYVSGLQEARQALQDADDRLRRTMGVLTDPPCPGYPPAAPVYEGYPPASSRIRYGHSIPDHEPESRPQAGPVIR